MRFNNKEVFIVGYIAIALISVIVISVLIWNQMVPDWTVEDFEFPPDDATDLDCVADSDA